MANPQVIVEYIAKTRDLKNAQGEIATTGGKAGAAMKSAFLPAVAVLGAVTLGAKKAIDASSALSEQIAASTVVFGKNAKAVQEWAGTGAEAFGLSKREALAAANAYGNMFNAVGLGEQQVAGMSKAMVQLAGDMASFHDQDPTEMLEKLRSGLAGEAEPLRQFGVLISEAAVKQAAYKNGIAKVGSELSEGQKVQARYALIMEKTKDAQGDFARTADSVANRQRTLAAQNENTAASFGEELLPVTQEFMGILQKLMGVVTANKGVLQGVVVVVTALAAAVVLANAGMAVYRAGTIAVAAATKIWAAAQWLLNAAMTANPIGLIIVGIAALIAALVLAYKKVDWFRKIVDDAFDAVVSIAKTLFNWFKQNWPLLLGIMTGPIGLATVLIIKNWDRIKSAVKSAVDFVKTAVSNAWNAVKNATSSAWDGVRNAVRDAVDAVKNLMRNMVEWISSLGQGILSAALNRVGNMFNKITDGARDAYRAVRDVLNDMVNWIGGIVDRVGNAASRVANAIKGPINSVLGAIDAVKITIPRISLPSIKIAGKKIGGGSIGGFTIDPFPNVPRLATGGVVDSPTLALVGEGSGREIVAPESLLREIVGGRSVNVRVYIGDQELRGLVRTEVDDANTGIARTLLAGAS